MATTIVTTVRALSNALPNVRYAVASRAALPILSHVRFNRINDQLMLEATNLEQWIRVPIKAMLNGELDALPALDYRFLNELCAKMQPEAELTLTNDTRKHEVTIRSQESEYRLLGLPVEEFPPFPEPDAETQQFTLSGTKLCRLVKKVLPATSKEEARALLQCVRVEVVCEATPFVAVVATDTHRLHYAADDAVLETPSISLAFHINQAHWASLLNHWEHQPRVECQLNSRGQLLWRTDHAEGALLTVEGTYPNYDRVIPKEYDKFLVLSARELETAVQRLLLFAEHNKVRMRYEPEPSQLVLEAIGEKGEGRETIAVLETDFVNFTEPVDVCAMNGRFILDTIRAFGIQTLRIEGKTPLQPFTLKEAQQDKPETAVVMPMTW